MRNIIYLYMAQILVQFELVMCRTSNAVVENTGMVTQ